MHKKIYHTFIVTLATILILTISAPGQEYLFASESTTSKTGKRIFLIETAKTVSPLENAEITDPIEIIRIQTQQKSSVPLQTDETEMTEAVNAGIDISAEQAETTVPEVSAEQTETTIPDISAEQAEITVSDDSAAADYAGDMAAPEDPEPAGQIVSEDTTETSASEQKSLSGQTAVVSEGTVTQLDLGYWYQGIDEAIYSEKIRKAVYDVPFAGKGYCAAWVSYVYQAAGLGFIGGNACDMWAVCCNSDNTDEIREGMIVAVKSSPTSEEGQKYGHCGIIIKNPNYAGTDYRPQILLLQQQNEELKMLREQVKSHRFLDILNEKIRKNEEEITRLTEEDTDLYSDVQGHLIQTDKDGNEKWLVVDATSAVSTCTLSRWIYKYNYGRTVAWGWGHFLNGEIVKWTGDLPATVPFVFHEEEKEEETTTEHREEETTQAKQEETKQEEPTKKTEKETTRQAEPETTTTQNQTTTEPETTTVVIQPETPVPEPETYPPEPETYPPEPETYSPEPETYPPEPETYPPEPETYPPEPETYPPEPETYPPEPETYPPEPETYPPEPETYPPETETEP